MTVAETKPAKEMIVEDSDMRIAQGHPPWSGDGAGSGVPAGNERVAEDSGVGEDRGLGYCPGLVDAPGDGDG